MRIFLVFIFLCKFVYCEPIDGQCANAPLWAVDGRNIMNENRGNVTLVALMELHCSFCRSQIEGFLALSKMLKNQSITDVQMVIIAPWNESIHQVEYFRRYLEPSGVAVVQESPLEPVWTKLKGSKDDFFIYDACGRLNYYIPYPQSYLYYHYTISTLYSTLRQEKCGPCRFITSLKVRAYLNVVRGNATTHEFGPDELTKNDQQFLLSTSPTPSSVKGVDSDSNRDIENLRTSKNLTQSKTQKTIRKPLKSRRKGRKTTTASSAVITTPFMDDEDVESTTVEENTSVRSPAIPTPVLISISSGEEDAQDNQLEMESEGEAPTSTEPSSNSLNETTAQIPAVTEGTASAADVTDIYDYEEEEYDLPSATDSHLNGGGAVGSVGAPVIGRRIIKKRYNRTTTGPSSTTPAISTTPAASTTTEMWMTTSWSVDPNAESTTEPKFGRGGWGPTRVPKLIENIDCTPYTVSMCYRQWQEFGTLHICCQRGVYLTDMCKQPLCNNATYNLCCFQKFQQARFQCCYDSDLSADHPDDFSRCCYRHFVFDDDGNGDGDDQCCPRATAMYFWTTQTRVAELCLPNVELDLDGIVLEARMADKSVVNIPLQKLTALQYECPYVDKRHDFFYWEPENGAADTAKPSANAIEMP